MTMEIERDGCLVGPGADDLDDVSRQVILSGQDPSGAYIASPTFSQYGYAWLRDGSFCAMAMDAIGEHESARRFHHWAAAAISGQRTSAEAVIHDLEEKREVSGDRMLPTRYRLDGTVESGSKNWPNFQLDGYGTWLFALYSSYSGDVPGDFHDVVRLVTHYLCAAWQCPCYDYWEESGGQLHTSTLAAIAAGLRAGARILGESDADKTADAVLAFMGDACVVDGAFVKGTTDQRVDGSLLSLAVPFGLVPMVDQHFCRTVQRIRQELSSPSGGIRRYVGDNYYGGSPWILLTAWLGWYERLIGGDERFQQTVDWVKGHVSPAGTLPEQVVTEPQMSEWVDVWVDRWGPVADPLLWSHAKYLLLRHGGPPATWT